MTWLIWLCLGAVVFMIIGAAAWVWLMSQLRQK